MANTVKVTISIDPDLLEKIDSFADENGMTRSGMIGLAAKQYLQACEAMPSMTQIIGKMANMFTDKFFKMSEQEQLEQIDMLEDQTNRILGKK